MDEKSRKTALRMLTYGVYVLTATSNDEICATTVTWVSQASFEPPMISVCIKCDSNTYHVVKKSNRFILHLLSKKQKEFAASFFKSTDYRDGLINGQSFEMISGLPILDSPPAYLVCKYSTIILFDILSASVTGELSSLFANLKFDL